MFDWFGEVPAAGVQWVDIIVSFIAFGIGLVALPTILQLFYGRPQLEIEFTVADEEDGRSLGLFLKNTPVKSRWLRRLGVTRDSIRSLSASFRISESGSGKVIVPIRHASLFTDEEEEPIAKKRITLPPTFSVGGSLALVVFAKGAPGVLVSPDRLRDPLPLAAGQYNAVVTVMVDGEPHMCQRSFVVGKKPRDLVWA